MTKQGPRYYVREGLYDSLEDVARLLLLAADADPAKAEVKAKRALQAAIKKGAYAGPKRRTSDDMLFLAARKLQLQARAKKKRCGDFTAIKKVGGRGWRTLYRKYERRGLTLKQIALLYADHISDKTTPTF
jgi:hypothetical protein